MTHPDVTVARSRAISDAIAGRYDNRETSQRGRIAYDTKHAQLLRDIEELGPARGSDEDVRRAEV